MNQTDELMGQENVEVKDGVGLKDLSAGQKVIGAGIVGAATYGLYSLGKQAIGFIKSGQAKKTVADTGTKIKNKVTSIFKKDPKDSE